MKALQTTLRWSALFAGIGLFLLLLNSAIYRAWGAQVPPFKHADGWIFAAWSNLAWSLASLLGGVGLFLLLRRPPRARIAGPLLVLALVSFSTPWVREFLAVDACLDAGGRWLEAELHCDNGTDGTTDQDTR